MFRLRKNQWALSLVITSLIILTISVLLACTVTYFAINIANTRVHDESLQSIVITKFHVWVPSDSPNDTEAAFIVVNTGGRDIVITKISVRGQDACVPPYPNASNPIQAVCYAVTNNSISKDLGYIHSVSTGGDVVSIDDNPANDLTLNQALGPMTLCSGESMVCYIAQPDSITINDIGLIVPLEIYTGQSMYYRETNVEVSVV